MQSYGQAGTVVWQAIQHAPERPSGRVFSFTPGTEDNAAYTFTNEPITALTAPESGRDWFVDHANVTDGGGNIIGVVACGYSFPPNWSFDDGCAVGTIGGQPSPQALHRFERRLGSVRQIVARFDANGNLLWFKFLNQGVAHGVIVDRNGDVVVCGQGYNFNMLPELGLPGSAFFNPAPGNLVTVASVGCAGTQDQVTLTKMSSTNGAVLWNHYYNTTDDILTALNQKCSGEGLVETNANNTLGYRIVGYHNEPVQRPIIVDVDGNGLLRFKDRFETVPGLIDANDGGTRAYDIARVPFAQGERFAVTGHRVEFDQGNRKSAWMMYMDDGDNDPLDAEWFKDIFSDVAYFRPNVNRSQNATRIAFASDGSVIWPVCMDYQRKLTAGGSVFNADVFAATENREATGRIYRFSSTGAPLWTSIPSIGLVRALDLYFSATQMANGDIAVATTKAAPGFGLDNPLDFADLPVPVQQCLTDASTGLGYDANGPNNPGGVTDWANLPWASYGHFGTDSYLALLRFGTGSLYWQYQWDEGSTGNLTTCFPENFRQRQCMFGVSDAGNGDIYVSGNTGHNFDDCYLARIATSCDAKEDYSFFEANYPLNASNQYVLPSSQTWTTSMNVRGSIIVPAGRTLTISACTLRFADSRKMGYTCNIVVQPQGKLFVQNGAVLTSLANCPESMWDGVRVLGTNNGDSFSTVGEFRLRTGATVSNAVVAATNCQVDPMAPNTAAYTSPGGIIITENAFLTNNRFGVVMRSFAFTGGVNALGNSRFFNTQFGTTGLLNYATESPQAHLWLQGVKRTRVGSSQFYNAYGVGGAPVETWGMGIRAINTALEVLPLCTGDQWLPGCPELDLQSAGSFSGLLRGIDYSTNVPRTCFIRRNVFDRCGGGVRLTNATGAVLTINDFIVPDVSTVSGGFAAAYGFGLWGCTDFTVENNDVLGQGSINQDPPNVGAIFDNTGANNNIYYNNTFDKLTYGTLIQASNDGPLPDDGLDLKCNDYGTTQTAGWNMHDVAYGGINPTVGSRQGSAGPSNLQAGNTFSSLCTSAETHMFVPFLGVNTFEYWHHAFTPGFVLKPTCRTDPPIVDGWFQNAFNFFNKTTACPGFDPNVGGGGGEQLRMAEATTEYANLKALYNAQRDGGGTEELKQFVLEEAHTSADVRNALLAAAPKVSIETWAEVFKRETPLNPWHLAQALVANSPLQAEVVRWMEESELTPFYKSLVMGAQNGGVSSLSILEAELNGWRQQHAQALKRLVHAARSDEGEVTPDQVLAWESQYPQMGAPWARIALLAEKGDYTAAKDVAQAYVAGIVADEAMAVQVLALDALLSASSGDALSAADLALLVAMAEEEGAGRFAAQAWLRGSGVQDIPERILLPDEERRPLPASNVAEESATGVIGMVSVYPNPATGEDPVYTIVRLDEGMGPGVLRLFDPQGKLVQEQRVAGSVSLIELPLKDAAPGLYAITLQVDGLLLASEKLIVEAR